MGSMGVKTQTHLATHPHASTRITIDLGNDVLIGHSDVEIGFAAQALNHEHVTLQFAWHGGYNREVFRANSEYQICANRYG